MASNSFSGSFSQLYKSNASSARKGEDEQQNKKKALEIEARNIILEKMVDDELEGLTRKEVEERKLSNRQRAINLLQKKLKVNDTFTAILAISGLIIALAEYEIYYSGDGSRERISKSIYLAMGKDRTESDWLALPSIPRRNISTPLTQTLRTVVSVSTLILMIPICLHMIINYRIATLTGKCKVGENVLKTKYFKIFLLEVLLNSIHSPPFIDYTFTVEQIGYYMTYSLDLILSNLMLVRIYLALRLFALYTKWKSPLSMKYCEIEGCEASTVFAVKASLKESPYLSLLIAFIMSAVILGIAVKNFEAPLNEMLLSGGFDFTLWNGVWLIVITMTTVGFGDYYARSHIGRLCSVLSIFWGIFLTSMMVVTLTNSMSLDPKETRAFNILYRLKARKNLKDKATFIVTHVIRAKALARDFERRKEGLDTDNEADAKKIQELERVYELERAEIFSKLDILKAAYHEAELNLRSAEEDPVEEIRKLSLAIERDFNLMRNYFIAIKEIEANLLAVQKSHEVIEKIIQQCKAYNGLFNKEILEYKGGLFELDKK